MKNQWTGYDLKWYSTQHRQWVVLRNAMLGQGERKYILTPRKAQKTSISSRRLPAFDGGASDNSRRP